MRIKAQPKWKWAAGIGAGLLLILLSVAAAGREEQTVGAFATGENEYTVRGALLMEAMDKVGVYSPEEAAQVWAQGVMPAVRRHDR